MKVLPYGDRAILAQYGTLAETMGAFGSLDATRPRGVLELVPAARTILVRIDPTQISLRASEQWLRAALTTHAAEGINVCVTIPVHYDGPDLVATAELLGIRTDELVSRHSSAAWHCAFIGFAPGFAYLAGTAGFDVPRRATSRQAVPPGSVGLAGEFTGIYPRSSPGGWQLIGTTDAVLWDASRENPSTITPGMTVRFEARP